MSGLAILGSCVTRDAFADHDPERKLTMVARTGFASLFSPGLPGLVLPERLGELSPGGFEDRCLRADLLKTGMDLLEQRRPDELFVDFMDDRFPLWSAAGSVFCNSMHFHRAGLQQLGPLAAGHAIPRRVEQAWTLWCDGLALFRARMRGAALSRTRLILHRSYQALRWSPGPDARLLQASIDRPDARLRLMQCNRMFARQHAAFEQMFPEACVIEVPEALRVASGEHRWGPAPCHFDAVYYESFAALARAQGIECVGR